MQPGLGALDIIQQTKRQQNGHVSQKKGLSSMEHIPEIYE